MKHIFGVEDEINLSEAEQVTGGDFAPGQKTTLALGEEGGEDLTTHAIGEEGGDVIIM